MNTAVLVRIPFGNTLTKTAQFPMISMEDAFKPKKTGTWWKVTLCILAVLVIAVIVLYCTGLLNAWGVPYHFLKPLKFWA